jgi:Cu/Ag efflux pump CusA
VDFVNRERAQGVELRQAVVDATRKRFRAILLTSLTTFFGLVPIVLETSLQAQLVIPMAASLAFGILFATAITLFLIPALYIALDQFGRWWGNAWSHVLPARLTQSGSSEHHHPENATRSSDQA